MGIFKAAFSTPQSETWWIPDHSLVVFGDSLAAGHNGYTAPLESGGPSGDSTSQSAYQVQQLYGGSAFTFANYGIGSTTLATILFFETGPLATYAPTAAILHGGINDDLNDSAWSGISSTLDSILATLDQRTHLFLDELWPWTSASDAGAAQIRTRNSRYATWAASNGVTLIASHDGMGQIRGSTGFYDDLKSSYDGGDGLHCNVAGYTAAAVIYKASMDGYF